MIRPCIAAVRVVLMSFMSFGNLILHAQAVTPIPSLVERFPVGIQGQVMAEVFGIKDGSAETAQIGMPTITSVQLPGLPSKNSSYRGVQVVVAIENPGTLNRATITIEGPNGETVSIGEWALKSGRWRYSCRFPAAMAPEGLCRVKVRADGPGQEQSVLQVLPGGLLLRTQDDGTLLLVGSMSGMVDLHVEDAAGKLVIALPSVTSLPCLLVSAGPIPSLASGQRVLARSAKQVCVLTMGVR